MVRNYEQLKSNHRLGPVMRTLSRFSDAERKRIADGGSRLRRAMGIRGAGGDIGKRPPFDLAW